MACLSVIRWRLLPSLPRSVGLGPGSEPPGAGDAGTINTGSAQIRLVRPPQLLQQQLVQLFPGTGFLPVPQQPAPAGHAAATTHFLRQVLPRNPSAQDKNDAIKARR